MDTTNPSEYSDSYQAAQTGDSPDPKDESYDSYPESNEAVPQISQAQQQQTQSAESQPQPLAVKNKPRLQNKAIASTRPLTSPRPAEVEPQDVQEIAVPSALSLDSGTRALESGTSSSNPAPAQDESWHSVTLPHTIPGIEEGKRLGNDLFQRQEYNGAVFVWGQAINAARAIYQDNMSTLLASVHCNRALGFMRLSMWQEAQEECQRSLSLDHQPKCVYRRGIARKNLGDIENAVADSNWVANYYNQRLEDSDMTIIEEAKLAMEFQDELKKMGADVAYHNRLSATKEWKLIEVGNKNPTRQWRLKLGRPHKLGRENCGADIGVAHASISRAHCKLLVEAILNHIVLEVTDLKSTNGTFVNGKKLPAGTSMSMKPSNSQLFSFGENPTGFKVVPLDYEEEDTERPLPPTQPPQQLSLQHITTSNVPKAKAPAEEQPAQPVPPRGDGPEAAKQRHVAQVRRYALKAGWGYIFSKDVGDIFLHSRNFLPNGGKPICPKQGDTVEFDLHYDKAQRPVAVRACLVPGDGRRQNAGGMSFQGSVDPGTGRALPLRNMVGERPRGEGPGMHWQNQAVYQRMPVAQGHKQGYGMHEVIRPPQMPLAPMVMHSQHAMPPPPPHAASLSGSLATAMAAAQGYHSQQQSYRTNDQWHQEQQYPMNDHSQDSSYGTQYNSQSNHSSSTANPSMDSWNQNNPSSKIIQIGLECPRVLKSEVSDIINALQLSSENRTTNSFTSTGNNEVCQAARYLGRCLQHAQQVYDQNEAATEYADQSQWSQQMWWASSNMEMCYG